jgi:formylmethanofuran dehydrogenase subunit E
MCLNWCVNTYISKAAAKSSVRVYGKNKVLKTFAKKTANFKNACKQALQKNRMPTAKKLQALTMVVRNFEVLELFTFIAMNPPYEYGRTHYNLECSNSLIF